MDPSHPRPRRRSTRLAIVLVALSSWLSQPSRAGTRAIGAQTRAERLSTLRVHTFAHRPLHERHDADVGVVDIGPVWSSALRQQVHERVQASLRNSIYVEPFFDRLAHPAFRANQPAPFIEEGFAPLIGPAPAARLAARTAEINGFVARVAPRLRLDSIILRTDAWARRMAEGSGFANQSRDPTHSHPRGTLTFTQAELGVGSGHELNPDGEAEGKLLLFGSQRHFTPDRAQQGKRLLAIWYYADEDLLVAGNGKVSGDDSH